MEAPLSLVIPADRLCQKSETLFKVEGISTRTPKKNCHPRERGDLWYITCGKEFKL